MESHPYSVVWYAVLSLVFVGILTYMVVYNLKQKARMKSIERNSSHPLGTEEGILLAQEQARHGAHARG